MIIPGANHNLVIAKATNMALVEWEFDGNKKKINCNSLRVSNKVSYKLNRLAHKTAEEAEAGIIHNPRSLEKNKKFEKIESSQPKMFERKFPGFRKNLYEYFVEYSSNTTIQGLRYVGEQSRPLLERFAWLIFFCISLYFCIDLIIKSYTKWETSPVLVSLATRPTPIWEIPFLALTICPEIKARTSVYNFTQNYQKVLENATDNMTEEEKKHFSELELICNTDVLVGNKTIGYDTIEFFNESAPEFYSMIWECEYPLSNKTCQEFFTPVLTKEGICYTFNMLDKSEVFRDNVFQFGDFLSHEYDSGGWTLEGGYKENTPLDTFPRRVVAAGAGSNFFIRLRTVKQDLDYVCNNGVQGYQIILHHPAEAPSFSLNHFRVSNNQEIIAAIKPDMMTTSKGLRNYHPHTRQCYFPEERYLAFYRTYTQQSCETECLTNFTKSKCGCVAFHMPHENETLICGSGSVECMKEAKDELLRKDFQSIMDKDEAVPNDPPKCDCLPGCVSLAYNAELSQADWNVDKVIKGLKLTNLTYFEGALFTNVFIFFKDQRFITFERNELYGSTDFLSSCGGILGLFTGFSFLSLVEILYFLSLRLFCNVKRYGRHYWSGSQELVNSDKYDHKK